MYLSNNTTEAKIKMLAMDLDGTMLTANQRIGKETMEMIRLAASMGTIITIATGRMYTRALPFANEIGVDVFLATHNGAFIKSTMSDQVIYEQTIPEEIFKEILWDIKSSKVSFSVLRKQTKLISITLPTKNCYSSANI